MEKDRLWRLDVPIGNVKSEVEVIGCRKRIVSSRGEEQIASLSSDGSKKRTEGVIAWSFCPHISFLYGKPSFSL